ncbi:hypothetical protein DFH09DRAFT_1288548 [Mycena vulgaris]|nr:hypothetical protein DFH09DRAFT_1288548 [Mycena vulgaris]
MDLLTSHPELAPDILKLLSDKAKVLERKLAEQQATTDLYAREISELEVENRRLETALATAEIKREVRDAHCQSRVGADAESAQPEPTVDSRLAQLEDEISTIQADRAAIVDQMSQDTEALRATVNALQSKWKHQSAELEMCKSDVNNLQDQLAQEKASAEVSQAMHKAKLDENTLALQVVSEKLHKANEDAAQAEFVREQIAAELALRQADIQSLGRKYEVEEEKLHDLQQSSTTIQDELKLDNAALRREKMCMTDERTTLAEERGQMKLQYEEEITKNAELQAVGPQVTSASGAYYLREFSKSNLRYETSIQDYMLMAEIENASLLKLASREVRTAFRQLCTSTRDLFQELAQDIDKERAADEAKIQEYKDENLKLHRDLDSLRIQVQHGNGRRSQGSSPRKSRIVEVKSPKTEAKTPLSVSPPTERGRYLTFMATFPNPPYRPPLNIPTSRLTIFRARKSAHFPLRLIWADRNFVHALAFAPTEQYRNASGAQTFPPCVASLCGNVCDLFVTGRGNRIYYAGIYFVHNLRNVHPPGSVIPADVAPTAIQGAIAAGLAATGKKLLAPIPNHELKTECFGLQCIGFDMGLYEFMHALTKKRKASGEPRADGQAKSQKVR